MKKLMVAALAAGMTVGAFAGDAVENYEVGYVYDMAMTLKTTTCSGKKTTGDAICKIDGGSDVVTYRKQITAKINGVFWGCGCEVIGCPTDNICYTNKGENGYFFWAANGKDVGAWIAPEFKWTVLNVVGKKAQNVEGCFTLKLSDDIEFTGAGYGTASIRKVADCIGEDDNVTDYNYIKSMKGYVVGTIKPGNPDNDEESTGCFYCGGTETTDCKAWAFCVNCDDTIGDSQLSSAAFGSWTLKYNSAASKKVRNGKNVVAADSKIKASVKGVWDDLLAQ